MKYNKNMIAILLLSNITITSFASSVVAKNSIQGMQRLILSDMGARVAPSLSAYFNSPFSSQQKRTYLSSNDLDPLVRAKDNSYKTILNTSIVTDPEEMKVALENYKKDIAFTYDVKFAANEYYAVRDDLFDFLKIPQHERHLKAQSEEQKKHDMDLFNKYRRNFIDELSKSKPTPSVLIRKCKLDQLESEFFEKMNKITELMDQYGEKHLAFNGKHTITETIIKRKPTYKVNERTVVDMAVVEGGYDKNGKYIGVSGKYDSSGKLVELEQEKAEELSPEDRQILASLSPQSAAALGLPVLPAISGEVVSLPSNRFGYDDKGKYIGEDGYRDKEGNIEQID